MTRASADPPYLGCCGLYEHHHGDEGHPFYGLCWDDASTYDQLLEYLFQLYPNGWALSASSPSLRTILPMCPADVRVAAWVKPFCAFKRGVRPCYAWEPVIFRGGHNPPAEAHPPPPKDGQQTTPKDFLAESIMLRKGLTGAKPPAFCDWVMDLLGVRAGDTIDDLFPGTGIFGERARLRLEAAA